MKGKGFLGLAAFFAIVAIAVEVLPVNEASPIAAGIIVLVVWVISYVLRQRHLGEEIIQAEVQYRREVENKKSGAALALEKIPELTHLMGVKIGETEQVHLQGLPAKLDQALADIVSAAETIPFRIGRRKRLLGKIRRLYFDNIAKVHPLTAIEEKLTRASKVIGASGKLSGELEAELAVVKQKLEGGHAPEAAKACFAEAEMFFAQAKAVKYDHAGCYYDYGLALESCKKKLTSAHQILRHGESHLARYQRDHQGSTDGYEPPIFVVNDGGLLIGAVASLMETATMHPFSSDPPVQDFGCQQMDAGAQSYCDPPKQD